MSLQDPISDMLTRIRNASAAGHDQVVVPHSKLKYELARILKQEGFVDRVSVDDTGSYKVIQLGLKYDRKDRSVIHGLRRISRPGLRRYVAADEVPRVLGGMGIAVLSTSKGILTDREARRAKTGGEVVCHIW
ncbi:MAG: 30S ribosomal protein S8 [Verrucomicrobia bacterium]|nr:30S ribosomal protein S8 [Kiritimatiellia bacterium]MCP5487364.1 30S ribosomal protein S8 [Verrucomicrobiota bacterium]